MTTIRKCPECGTELPANVPEGQCPKCLLKVAIGSQPEGAEGTEPTPPQPAPPAPAELAKHFPQLEILELLGQGGMGVVYKARQPRLDRLVALKILPADPARDPAFAERFTREARALASLSHPNLVAVYDFGETDGIYYFMMEYVDGLNLRQLEQAGKLSPREALQVVPAICDALQFAHDQGIVHRDIKPENILVDKLGRVKIADFGLAKLLGRPAPGLPLTQTRQVMGTPNYMAPEQIEAPQQVDQRADIYSLVVVFYEMLTGELPIGRFAPPSQKVQVDVRLDEVVLRALEKERERRYQQASEVKTDVEYITTTPAQTVPPVAASKAMTEWESARRTVRAPAIGLLVTGLLNWVLVPVMAIVFMYIVSHAGGLPGAFTAAILIVMGVSTFMIVAALKMKALEAYGVAVAGSILAIAISPGNLIGLPIGIWALVTLTRTPVRAAFRTKPSGPMPELSPATVTPVLPSADRARRWFFTTATVVLIGFGVLVLIAILGLIVSLALPALSRAKQAARQAQMREVLKKTEITGVVLRSFSTSEATLSQDLTVTADNAWFLSCTNAQVVRLFEVTNPDVEQCLLTYRAQLKTEGLQGRAYLEMWCRFPGRGEFFSRGLDHVVSGSTDWMTCQTPFLLKQGEKPDLIRLNLAVEGVGKVWMRDVELLRSALPK